MYHLRHWLWSLFKKEIPTASYADVATWPGALIKVLATIAVILLQICVLKMERYE